MTFAAGPHTYRRRIEIVPAPGVVQAAMEDYIHHFEVVVHHDGEVVRRAGATGVRSPWDTCAIGAAGVAALAGTPLADASLADRWVEDKRDQCVHVVDTASLAAAHALDEAPLTYEVRVDIASFAERHAVLRRDGDVVLDWRIEGQQVVDGGACTGMGLDRASFSRWLEHVPVADREALFVLRRACSIALGRLIDLDAMTYASDARPADESCHTYRSEVVDVAVRNRGTWRTTEDDDPGTPIPGGPISRQAR